MYAAFLDLSKAFDMVSYEKLWTKLKAAGVPPEIIGLFSFWYDNQLNYVRWADTYSDGYKAECGVRQGGLTSPLLFNMYVNQLIVELSGTRVGCSIGGKMVNNISYADDMVLLGPTVGAINKLLSVCEAYANSHGLCYNAKKSELLIFRASRRSPSEVPPVTLCGTVLSRVTQFKYLGHIVTEDLTDDDDIERERRALAVRTNMLIRRFARSNAQVKRTLFKSYCQTFYACSLWIKYTKRTYGALRVQFNNGYRMLLGLPRFCSASGMFAEARMDDFYAIMRKRTASQMHRLRNSSNSFLTEIGERLDNPFCKCWASMHVPIYRMDK